MEVGVSFDLTIGSIKMPRIFSQRYQKNQLQDGKGTRTGHEWSKGITISIPVFILRVGVDFSLNFQVNNQLSFPADGNTVDPVKLAVEIEPFAEVTASIEAYASAYSIRGGVYGDGTIVRVSLPVTLSYQAGRSRGKKWCVALSSRLTALELSAGIFYQWWDWWDWDWGKRRTIKKFGKSKAIEKDWQVLSRCS
ncbi:hypothetical protein OS493_033446 [Desmophyllum pertusum]|uniref:Uncharacterized protein n=1 Tax=Desmophyllum pertusum TaxID=174260 RepID=A0A9W9ZZZ7_9CNID|nr:hypothetical protein OS493_033446 [Desmophyllum pertusum]